ncbi:molybdenum cofactor biosynthesis protein B [Zooshikella sp. RANM57]|uniref:molybdenum cofactor biosynthesis protein B n=1 Tax=Zooshikella sp. RANM57 TaxID=3425863 RepID=UPI003D6FE970
MGKHSQKDFVPLSIAVLTVSDTRDETTDTSGQYLVNAIEQAGHTLHSRCISKDDIYQLRAIVSAWIADNTVQVILVTGGTGFTDRDSTPEALLPLFDKTVDGFGELFRHISFQEIGTSTLQSRAIAGLANHTLICCLPGSTGACRTGWDGILQQQLDARHGPCNFIPHLKLAVAQCDTRQ